MSELDIVSVVLERAGAVPSALVVIAACCLLFWVLWGRLSKGVVKDGAEVDTYKMLIEDNKRLSALVDRLGRDIEALQRSLFAERESCFERISELHRKVDGLERRLQGVGDV